MKWLEETLGMELSTGAQWALLFLVLAVTLAILFWTFRMIFGYGGGAKLSRNRQPRLSVTDAAMVDDKRRLVLVRRDNVEHLVMIGGPSDIVIEQGIERSQTGQSTSPAQSAKTQTPQPHSPQPFTGPASSKTSTEANETGRSVNEPAPAAAAGLAAASAAPVASAASETPSSPNTSNHTDTSAKSFRSEAPQRLSQSVSGTEHSRAQGTAAQAPDEPQSDPGTLDDVKPDWPEASTATEKPSQSASSKPTETRKDPDIGDFDGSTESDNNNSRTEDEMQRLLDELTTEKR